MIEKIKEAFKNKSFLSFFKRSLLFLGIFLSEILALTLVLDFTGLDLGYVITSTDAHLTVYIFLLVFFMIATEEIVNIKAVKSFNKKRFILFLVVNLLAVFGFYALSRFFMANPSSAAQNPLLYSASWWGLAFLIGVSALFACFDFKYIGYFLQKFKKQVFISAGISLLFVFLLKYSMMLWPFFSKIVGKSVFFLLNIFFNGAMYQLDADLIPTVGIPAVSAKIYAPCSGIEGMSLFLMLFTVLVLFERGRLDNKKVAIAYVVGLIGAFLVNVLRTFLIFVAGYFVSAEFAIGAFHSNVGWVAFTLYFLIFIYVCYPWMRK